jgi:hypothetical protein
MNLGLLIPVFDLVYISMKSPAEKAGSLVRYLHVVPGDRDRKISVQSHLAPMHNGER